MITVAATHRVGSGEGTPQVSVSPAGCLRDSVRPKRVAAVGTQSLSDRPQGTRHAGLGGRHGQIHSHRISYI